MRPTMGCSPFHFGDNEQCAEPVDNLTVGLEPNSMHHPQSKFEEINSIIAQIGFKHV